MLESTERTIKNEQSRDTVNIGHKKNPTHNTTWRDNRHEIQIWSE